MIMRGMMDQNQITVFNNMCYIKYTLYLHFTTTIDYHVHLHVYLSIHF